MCNFHSRLSVDPSGADSIIAAGGLDHLVELVRARAVRGDSDNILTAALSAIRSITVNRSGSTNGSSSLDNPPTSSLESFV